MRNILLTIAYDGKNYHGWQIQKNALSVQEVFQNALFRVTGEENDIKGCSRTDTGVHANMYCVSFKTEHRIPVERIPAAVNNYLPDSIAVLSAKEADEGFHARYSCKGKEYVYKIWNNHIRNPFLNGYALHYWCRLDMQAMKSAAEHFVGKHDFTSFCTVDNNRKKGDFHRTVECLAIKREGDLVSITIRADGFLYNMVRIIVGTLIYVSEGKIAPNDIPGIIEARERTLAGPTAPPVGLYLNKVFY